MPGTQHRIRKLKSFCIWLFLALAARTPGTGQFGTVRRCTERLTGARFACKTISKDRLRSEAEQEEVRREVALMQRVGGKRSWGDAGGGASRGGAIAREFSRTSIQSHRPSHTATREASLHRDLKPENILLTRDPSAPFSTAPLTTKLADFGLAVPLQSGNRAMGVAGSPFYMAPEDVFVEVLKGVVDLSGEEWAGVSEEAKRLVLCLLQRNPQQRPTAAQILFHPWILRHCHTSVAGLRTGSEAGLGFSVGSDLRAGVEAASAMVV
ncbi:unnamed protein product [Closterium sp. NIES-64]|nr:unnamed protein product [Closterium sp. NIES-64]